MLTVDDYARIRLAHRDGMSIREIARVFGHSRRKIREVLAQPQPAPYTRTKAPPAPVLGSFHQVIDDILAADEDAPPKQRHTAMQVYRRLRDEHSYTGGYDQVRRYVGKHRRSRKETFIPLAHDPGIRLEADFGHIHVDFPDGRRLVPVLINAWAYSNYGFALALPTERTEAILAGMVAAFTFFGCVPREVWWDNPTTVVRLILKGRERRPNEYYQALASHYRFEPSFCMPARGNEKPRAETRVRVLQQQWATPVPSVAGLDGLNAHLRQRATAELSRTVQGHEESIGQRFARDRARALPLPEHAFDPCIQQAAVVDKYQTVQFDNNRYSVPRACAYRAVMVKGYIDKVEVADGRSVVAVHRRSYGKNEQVLDPLHYLATLGRKPAALDHAPVMRDWNLPASFLTLRGSLEQRHGPHAGARQYIRVLQLLAEHPLLRVQQAVEACTGPGQVQVERIAQMVQRLAERDTGVPVSLGAATPEVQVPRPDLGRFDELLRNGEEADGE
ncbi:MAG TPA: IS21 family transposase [Gemmataceae bacterium]|nr:IS21 family transposase [Gemmataceae bacterium]